MKYLATIDGNSYVTDDADFVLSLMRPGRDVSLGMLKSLVQCPSKLLHLGNRMHIADTRKLVN